jgi:hypothetical protein
MRRIESVKRSERLVKKKSKTMGLEYERVVQLVGKGFNDLARKSNKTLSSAELNELMYGEKGLLTEAVEYGKIHAAK